MNFVYVRENSDDRSIWTSVVNDDEYRIGTLKESDIVLDIGMHTGSFVARAYLAGSRHIFGFEPDLDNFRLAQANVGNLAAICNAAVGRSDDRATEVVYHTGHIPMPHELNTGVGNIFGTPEDGKPVQCIPFDHIVGIDNIRLVKMDIEGGEWPLLYTSQKLAQVQEFVGEWHLNHPGLSERLGIPECSLETLCAFMRLQGFATHCSARTEDLPSPLAGNFHFVCRELYETNYYPLVEGRTTLCASGF